jgi:hypothetical protein
MDIAAMMTITRGIGKKLRYLLFIPCLHRPVRFHIPAKGQETKNVSFIDKLYIYSQITQQFYEGTVYCQGPTEFFTLSPGGSRREVWREGFTRPARRFRSEKRLWIFPFNVRAESSSELVL